MRRLSSLLLLSSTVLAGLGLAAGCGSGGGSDDLVDNGFESDDPTGKTAASRGESTSADAGAGSASPSDPSSGAEKNDSAQRAVEEADILKVDGNRLYALSRYGGLAIVDISNPDALKLLGRKRTDGIPFEMYVRNGRAYIMMNEFGRYVREPHELYGQWVQSSEILAFDVTDPASVKDLATYDVPGTIADSRVVGDALYLVTFENGYCWKCSQTPSTIVTSFGIGGASIEKVDQLSYSAPDKNYSAWQRSVSATNERLYIGGPQWNWAPNQTNASSIIQVVDIKDPTGKLVKGAEVPVAGQINSRWQMEEYNGVLRVVSQYGNGWRGPNGSMDPLVQTFTVASSQTITPLGQTNLKLPKPESLRSVRFDGTRGYAITAERTDPLFTIDLSNPAQPKQAGELEMPGWIFHMEPRGDRLIGFGYEGTNWDSRLAVSLFDVSDLTKPTMLKRVPFGKGRGNVAEDQDRIHKSVRVLDESGLILVPFASYGTWSEGNCAKGESGIQLIDYTKNDLVLRGIAPQWGMPRRAFLANDRLFAISDRNVSSFDIASHDAPVKKSELDLSNPAYKMAALPNHIASITNDWWSGEVMLSLTPKEKADDASIIGKVSLASLAEPSQALCAGRSGWTSWYSARVAVNGTMVYVAVPTYTYAYAPNTSKSKRGGRLSIAAVDAADPAHPKLVGKADVNFTEHDNESGRWGWYGGDGFWDGYGYYSYSNSSGGALVGSGTGLVQLGSKLAYLEVDYEPYEIEVDGKTKYDARIHRKLHVVDMANPSAPIVNEPVDLGESYGATPLHLAGSTVLTSRWIRSNNNPNKVRFFVDRVDIAGGAPVRLSSVNTPGSLLHIDEQSSRWVTTDYVAERTQASNYQECRAWAGYRARFDYDSKECVKMTRSFKLADVAGTKVTLKSTFTPPSQNLGGIQLADDRIYVTRYKQYDYSSGSAGPNGMPKVLEDGGLWAIGGIRDGELKIVSEMKGNAQWPLAAKGTKIALYTEGGLEILDTATPTPKKLLEANLRGYGYSSHVLLDDDKAVCSLGEWGIQTIGF